MKKLLFVAPAIGYGGAEKNFIGIANYAVEHGYCVYLLIEEDGKILRPISPDIVIYRAKIDHSANQLVKYCQAITAIRRSIKKSNADVVISFIELWRSACILATRLSRVKCLVSERSDPYTRNGRFNNIIFSIFGLAEGHVFQTEQARQFFPKSVQRKSVVIPNPVFSEDVLDKYDGNKKNIIVNIARLDVKQKRQDLLIRAFNLIKEEIPEYSLYLYGDGPDKALLEKLIKSLKLENRVFLKGLTRDIYTSLGEAKLMVLTSDYEGIPNAIIESMCVGVPVISTKCSPGGAEFLIQNKVNGVLVERGAEIELAKEISHLLSNPLLYQKIIKNGFLIKEKLNYEEIMEKWVNYINWL